MGKYNVALYLRSALCAKVENNEECCDIKNQRALINEFIANVDIEIANTTEFCDHGYSGLDFDRPGFSKLVENIEQGRINCIIISDISRLGRHTPSINEYLEKIFPALGVRVISIAENYDSARNTHKPFIHKVLQRYSAG